MTEQTGGMRLLPTLAIVLVVVLLAVVALGPWMMSRLVEFARMAFSP